MELLGTIYHGILGNHHFRQQYANLQITTIYVSIPDLPVKWQSMSVCWIGSEGKVIAWSNSNLFNINPTLLCYSLCCCAITCVQGAALKETHSSSSEASNSYSGTHGKESPLNDPATVESDSINSCLKICTISWKDGRADHSTSQACFSNEDIPSVHEVKMAGRVPRRSTLSIIISWL